MTLMVLTPMVMPTKLMLIRTMLTVTMVMARPAAMVMPTKLMLSRTTPTITMVMARLAAMITGTRRMKCMTTTATPTAMPTHAHAHAHAHAHDASGELDPVQTKIWAAAGTLFGVLAMVAGPMVSPDVVGSNVTTFLRTLGVLLLESAPALLLGYALAGLVPFLLTASRAAALGRGSRLSQSLKGVAFGLPLPVCSCGVLPLYESLIRRGAPPVAAMAFFVATPELGLDAVLLSVPLLGTSLTVARVVAAFLVAVIVAHLVGRHATASKGTGGSHCGGTRGSATRTAHSFWASLRLCRAV